MISYDGVLQKKYLTDYLCNNYGTVIMDTNIPQEERAVIKTGEENKVVLEIRSFKNTYLPIPQSELDRNPNLVQTNFE